MTRWWKLLLSRIDALSLRERVFLFVSLLVVCLMLADVLWLSPVQTAHQQVAQRFAAQNAELLRLQEALKASSAETGPGRQMREELARVRERLQAVDQEIAQLPKVREDQISLSRVLTHFLRRHEGLVLVRTATLANETRAGAEASASGLRRQGVELTVSGSYHELTRYVQTLEQALPALRWGGMKVNSERQPAELTLQVWLLGEHQ